MRHPSTRFSCRNVQLEYTDNDGKLSGQLVHRTIIGLVERFVGILTDIMAAPFPLG